MKRLFTLLMALVMLSTMTAFAAEEYTFPLTEEPITLTVFHGKRDQISDPATNESLIAYEEKTGVHIELITSSDISTDLNLMIASGEHADLYLFNPSTAQVTNMVNAGMIIPLNDLIDQYGYYTQQILEERPDFLSQITTPDGNIYTLFETDCGLHMPNRRKMYVYEEWLNEYRAAVGSETAPSTTQEFEEMLKYFRDNDMNGNGQQDEIPLIASTNGEDNPMFWLMSAFTMACENYIHITDEGEIVFEANTDEWKAGLEWMNHLYEEGLFYAEESFVQDRDQLKATVNVADPSNFVVACSTSFWQGRFVDSSVMNWTDWQPIPPISSDIGEAIAPVRQLESFSLAAMISSECKYPEVAFKWLDWWLSPEGTIANVYGFNEGTNYEVVDAPSINGDPTSINVLQNFYTDNFRLGENMAPKYDTPEVRYAVTLDAESMNTNNTYVLHEAGSMYEPYYVLSNIPKIVWCDDETLMSEMAEYQTLINDTVKVAYTEFILGIRDIDTEWEAYIDELNAVGLDYYMELLNQYYA